MFTGLLVFLVVPLFVLILVVRIIYGFYKDYKENQEFEEYLRTKYRDVYENKTKTEKVKAFAKKNGFGRIFHLGQYQGAELYKALNTEPNKSTGTPSYILEKDGIFELRTGEQGLAILKSYKR